MTSDPNDGLLERAERLLARLELAESVEPDWERLARRIGERLSETSIGSTSAELLRAPLPETSEEGSLPAQSAAASDRTAQGQVEEVTAAATETAPAGAAPADKGVEKAAARVRPGGSPRLAEMARASVNRRHDADALDIVRQSMTLARSALKAPQQSAATHSSGNVPETSERSSLSAARAKQQAGRAASSEPRSEVQPLTRDSRGPGITAWLGLGIGMLGVAAAVAMYLSIQSKQPLLAEQRATAEAVSTAQPVEPEMTEAVEAEPREPASAARPLDQESEKASQNNDAVDANEPAEQPAAASASVATRAQEPAAPVPAPPRERAKGTTAPVKGAGEAGEKVVLAEEPAESSGAAAGTGATPAIPGLLRPADTTGSERPETPSKGAVLAALGTVMGSARACVAGQEAPSRAVVVFGSNGQVQSVSVSGPAAGTPSEQCIVSALRGARVAPFGRSTFAASASIRP